MRRLLRLGRLGGVGALLATGCGGNPDCFGWKQGHRYAVEILERYDENSSFEFFQGGMRGNNAPCGNEFGPHVGETITVVPTNLGPDDRPCQSLRGEVRPRPPLEGVENIARPPDSGDVLLADYVGTLNGCETFWLNRFYRPRPIRDVFETPSPGRRPPVVLERIIETRGSPPNCGTFGCLDYFVVHVRK